MTRPRLPGRLARRFGIYLAIGLFAAAAWSAYERLSAPGKIDAALAGQMRERNRVDILVQLGFSPEQTHIKIFQEFGAVVGVTKNELTLMRVRSDDVAKIARYYWVRRVTVPRPRGEK